MKRAPIVIAAAVLFALGSAFTSHSAKPYVANYQQLSNQCKLIATDCAPTGGHACAYGFTVYGAQATPILCSSPLMFKP